jgi:Tfp pilus assembly protein PilO
MNKQLFKILPWLIIFYGGFNCYTLYTEHEENSLMLQEQLAASDTQLVKIKKKVANIKQNEEKLREYETKISEVRKQIEELKVRMPSEADQTAVLQELTNTAQELNLKDVTFNPAPKADRGMYLINTISLSGKGTYLQFLILFEKIKANKRFFNVDNFQLVESPADNKGRFIFVNVKADLQTYEYNQNYKEPEVQPKT